MLQNTLGGLPSRAPLAGIVDRDSPLSTSSLRSILGAGSLLVGAWEWWERRACRPNQVLVTVRRLEKAFRRPQRKGKLWRRAPAVR